MKQKSLTKEQVAVIETAKSYLIRGSRIQYADTRFTSREFPDCLFTWDEYRWESRGHRGNFKKIPKIILATIQVILTAQILLTTFITRHLILILSWTRPNV